MQLKKLDKNKINETKKIDKVYDYFGLSIELMDKWENIIDEEYKNAQTGVSRSDILKWVFRDNMLGVENWNQMLALILCLASDHFPIPDNLLVFGALVESTGCNQNRITKLLQKSLMETTQVMTNNVKMIVSIYQCASEMWDDIDPFELFWAYKYFNDIICSEIDEISQ